MQDHEILRMATFKLQEAAHRIANLARECHSQLVREHLLAVVARLGEQEAQLRARHDVQSHRASTAQGGAAEPLPHVKRSAAA